MSALQERETNKELIDDISFAELLHYVKKYYGWAKHQVVYINNYESLDVVYMIVFDEIFKKSKAEMLRSFVKEIVNQYLRKLKL